MGVAQNEGNVALQNWIRPETVKLCAIPIFGLISSKAANGAALKVQYLKDVLKNYCRVKELKSWWRDATNPEKTIEKEWKNKLKCAPRKRKKNPKKNDHNAHKNSFCECRRKPSNHICKTIISNHLSDNHHKCLGRLQKYEKENCKVKNQEQEKEEEEN